MLATKIRLELGLVLSHVVSAMGTGHHICQVLRGPYVGHNTTFMWQLSRAAILCFRLVKKSHHPLEVTPAFAGMLSSFPGS